MKRVGWEGNICWRGTVGLIKPNFRPGSTEDLIRLLPPGIGVIPLHLDMRGGTRAEFATSLPDYEAHVAHLAELGADLVHPAGAPPFFLLGYDGEQRLIDDWQRKYHVPVFTNGMTQINALHALGIKRFVGVSYFRGEMNDTFAAYFVQAGFDVLAMVGLDVDFDKVQSVASREIYRWIKQIFIEHPGADGVYMLGPGWLTLDIIETLEQDLGVPVVHHIPAQSWEIQRRLLVRQPLAGYGQLLAEMPPLPDLPGRPSAT